MSQGPAMGAPAASRANGAIGTRFEIITSPVMIGITAIRISGTRATRPKMIWALAESEMPRFWMTKAISRMVAPRMAVALIRRLSPSLMKSRWARVICQVLMAASEPNKVIRT